VVTPGPNNYFWVPIVAPLIGGGVGAVIYDFIIYKALEIRGCITPLFFTEKVA
jgi:hypothetical protein